MAREGKVTLQTETFDKSVVGRVISYKQYDVSDIKTGYTPALWDVVARDASDSNLLKKYDAADANHVVCGIVGKYDASYTDADFILIERAEDVAMNSLGITNLSANLTTAAEALRDKGIYIL